MEPEAILLSNAEQLPGEVWRSHPRYPDYEVSTLGRWRSLRSGRLLRQSPDSPGYLRVQVIHEDKAQQAHTAHAVLETFVGPRPDDHQAAHLNGVRTDNRLANLRWCTPAENESHKVLHGTKTKAGHENANAKVCEAGRKLVRALVLDKGYRVVDVSAMSGLPEQTVRNIALARR